MKILKKLILVCPLVALVYNITKGWKETKELEERARRHMADIDAEEQKREAERRDIPKPERPEDATVGEVKSRLYCSDRCIIKKEGFALFCKGKIMKMYPTKAEAEAARLQFLYDHGVTDKEDFTL